MMVIEKIARFQIADGRSGAILLFVAIVAGIPGCGSRSSEIPLFPVSGSVLIDGKPLAKGFIMMEGAADAASGLVPAGADITNGTYTMQARSGQMRVRIMAPEPYGVEDTTGERPTRETVAAAFNQDSQLFVEVKAHGDNRFDFEVKGR